MNNKVRFFTSHPEQTLSALLRESIRACEELIGLSLKEQGLWRRGRVSEALKLLSRKRTLLKTYRHLEHLRHGMRRTPPTLPPDNDGPWDQCRHQMELLHRRNAFLEIVNQNTTQLARRRLGAL